MEREDMIKRIKAGDSLVDICLDKYREVQCKITNDEDIDVFDVGERTCALCYKFLCSEGGCGNCPLTKARHKCTQYESAWRKLYAMVRDEEGTKEEKQNAVDDMISDLKDAKEYEVQEVKRTYHIGQNKQCNQ
jgi:hypothetical protein